MTTKYGSIVDSIIEALGEHGPMTRAELAKHIGVDPGIVSPILSRMHKPSKRPPGPKRVYVSGWTHEGLAATERAYPRALYALGAHDDAEQPRAKRTKTVKREYDQANAKLALSSVFDLALNRSARTAKLRAMSLRVKR